MEWRAKIAEVLEPYLEGGRFFVVDVQVSASRIKPKVTVLLDSDAGITIDECAEISRKLGQRLEELNWFETAYTLEVSSPGVDFPLTSRRQYVKHVGRQLQVSRRDGSTHMGTLQEVGKDSLTLLEAPPKGKKKPVSAEPVPPLTIPFADIQQSQVLVSFK
jgi:ribosome maturation factor RimP